MKNQRGFISVVILLALTLAGALVLFVPNNPVGNFLGVGVKPNKIVQTDTTTLIKDDKGVPYAYREVTKDDSVQQHVTFWQWLTSLPIIVLILMGAGIVCPPIALFLHNINQGIQDDIAALRGDTKKIVASVELGLATITDPAAKLSFLAAMSKAQDSTTKNLVADLKRA